MKRALLVVLLLVLAAFPSAQQGQPANRPVNVQLVKSMDKSTYFQMESVSSPAISPDGLTVLFSRGYVDMTRDQNRSNLWMIGITGSDCASSRTVRGRTHRPCGRPTASGSRFSPIGRVRRSCT